MIDVGDARLLKSIIRVFARHRVDCDCKTCIWYLLRFYTSQPRMTVTSVQAASAIRAKLPLEDACSDALGATTPSSLAPANGMPLLESF